MVNWIVTVTDEGAALIASVIASQGTLNFTEARISDVDYYGDESSLTEATFAGVYLTTTVSASIVDLTKIKMNAMFDLSGLTEAHDIATVGFIANDGGLDVLLAVLTTEDAPDTAEPGIGINGGYISFNVNLAVSSTQDITVVGTTAAVLYDTDIIDDLNSTDATKPLSANMGHTLGEEVNAVVNVYGAKNLLPNEGISATSSGVTFTVNDDKSITINADGTNATEVDFYFYNHTNSVHDDWSGAILSGISGGSNTTYQLIVQYRNPNLGWLYLSDGEETLPNTNTFDSVRIRVYANTTLTNVTVKPMIRDARIVDPTYEPFAETNQQLTVNKAERADLASLNLTGTKNTTGATITAGTYFYLNGRYCRVIQDIGNNADFTENTNYVVTSLGSDLQGKYIYETSVQFNAYADGVKTNQTLINDVMTQLQSWKASNPNRAYQFNFLYLGLNSCTPYDLYLRTAYFDMSFKGMGFTLTDFFLRVIIAKTSASESYRGVGTFTLTDESHEVATNDVALIINVYQIL